MIMQEVNWLPAKFINEEQYAMILHDIPIRSYKISISHDYYVTVNETYQSGLRCCNSLQLKTPRKQQSE